MIQFPGYEDCIKRVYNYRQEHVFAFWEDLDDAGRRLLLNDLAEIDFDLLARLYAAREAAAETDYEPAPVIGLPSTEEDRVERERARRAGEDRIRAGKVAAFVVAGGQGSRLGYEGPKGKFPIGPVSGKSLFQIHCEKVKRACRVYHTRIPYLVMTSQANHNETVSFFREHQWFGLNEGDVYIFPQNMIPSLDMNGKLILETTTGVFKNPDGHGGSLTALRTSGVLDELKARGIDIISYYQVDNPLVRIIDPVFIGFHHLRGAEASSKAVAKAYPEEKVGVFVRYPNGSTSVIEYSDLPQEKARERDAEGRLLYWAGSIAIHLFDRSFVERITSGEGASLPYHTAVKTIRGMTKEGVRETQGLKFEKFVFDALPLTDRNVVFETLREEEFAPVKNPAGIDSVESARAMMDAQARRWLLSRGIAVPTSVKVIEISPLVAAGPEDIDAGLVIPDRERVYIEA